MGRFVVKKEDVFKRYQKSQVFLLSQFTYRIYLKWLKHKKRKNTLTEAEMFHLELFPHSSVNTSIWPLCDKEGEADNKLELYSVDFFDYLPKELLPDFIETYKSFALKYGLSRFSSFRTEEEIDSKLTYLYYGDGYAYSSLPVVTFKGYNDFSDKLLIKIRNYSSSFVVIQYKFYIKDFFSDDLMSILKTQFEGSSEIAKMFTVPWYKPSKFGKTYYEHDYIQKKKVYEKVSTLKWSLFTFLHTNLKLYIPNNEMFLPSFETYAIDKKLTLDDIQINKVLSNIFGSYYDCCKKYSFRVYFDFFSEKDTENHLQGVVSGTDVESSITLNNLADIYANYLVASTVNDIVSLEINSYYKRIKRSIKNSYINSIFKVKYKFEQKFYYINRLLSEFTGKSIDYKDMELFEQIGRAHV